MAKNTSDSTRTLSPAVMALVGGVVGAGMALFLSDEKRRQKIVNMVTDLKDSAGEVADTIRERGVDLGNTLATEVEETTERVRRVGRTAADGVRSMARDTVEDVRDTSDQVANDARKTKEKVKDDAQKVKKDVEDESNGRGR